MSLRHAFLIHLLVGATTSLAGFGASAGSAAQPGCLLILDMDQGAVLEQSGELCDVRFTPASSFKIALALMGYESGILIDAAHPRRPYKAEYKARRQTVKRDTTPQSWLADSVVWYSQVLTRQLGFDRFRAYLDALNYGNRKLSPVKGRGDPLVSAWLSASLKISPREQVVFMRRFLGGRLPVSNDARNRTMAIMPLRDGGDGLMVYGKTGTGFADTSDGSIDFNRQIGWYVGWAERKGRRLVFAKLLLEREKRKGPAGFRARDEAIAELKKVLISK